MLLADVLFLAIVVYLAYRFIFNFVLPIVRATHQVRQQFRNNFGGAARDSGGAAAQSSGGSRSAAGSRSSDSAGSAGSTGSRGKRTYKPPAEDYIDFEEIK